jgi:hypothetical protein
MYFCRCYWLILLTFVNILCGYNKRRFFLLQPHELFRYDNISIRDVDGLRRDF